MTEVAPILFQPTSQDVHGSQKVVSLKHHQVDVVEIPAATETMRKVVARIDRGPKFTATGALKAEAGCVKSAQEGGVFRKSNQRCSA